MSQIKTEDIASTKAFFRKNIRARRKAQLYSGKAPSFLPAMQAFFEIHNAARIAAYLPAPAEPGDLALICWLRQHYQVFLPQVASPIKRTLNWIDVTADLTITTGAFQLPEPVGTPVSPLPSLDVIFVPALAVSPTGVRLGQGGGFYDSFLSARQQALPHSLCVALVFDEEVSTTVPAEPHDLRCDFIITPTRILNCATASPCWELPPLR